MVYVNYIPGTNQNAFLADGASYAIVNIHFCPGLSFT